MFLAMTKFCWLRVDFADYFYLIIFSYFHKSKLGFISKCQLS